MAEHGVRSAHGAQVATLDSRPAKPEIVDEDILREGWRRRAAEVGFSGNVPTGPHHSVVASDDQLGTLLTEQDATFRSEEHTSELQSLMRISYAVFCLKKQKITVTRTTTH